MDLQVSPGTKLQTQCQRRLFQNCAQMKTEDAKSIVIAAISTNIQLGRVTGLKTGEFNSQTINQKGNIQEISVTDTGHTQAHQVSL